MAIVRCLKNRMGYSRHEDLQPAVRNGAAWQAGALVSEYLAGSFESNCNPHIHRIRTIYMHLCMCVYMYMEMLCIYICIYIS